MPSPNVGKVTVGVEFDTKGIQAQLTKSLSEKLTPVLNDFNAKAATAATNIQQINKQTLDEIAKSANMAQQKTAELLKKLEREKKLKEEIAKLEERHYEPRSELRLKRTAARSAATREETKALKENRAVDESYAEARLAAENEFTAAVKKTEEAKGRLSILQTEIAQKREADNKSWNNKVEAQRKAQIKGIKDVLGAERDAINERVQLAIEASKSTIDASNKATKEHLANLKKVKKQEEDDLEYLQKRRKELATFKGFRRGFGEVTRSLTGLQLNVSTGAMLALTTGATLLGGAVASLSKTLLLLPAGLGATYTALGALQIGFMGVGDAVKYLMSGDLDNFDHAITQLAPNAQQAVLTLQKLGPVFSELRKSVQNALFKDSPQMISAMVKTYLPAINNLLTSVASSINKFMSNVAKELLKPEVMKNMGVAMANIAKAFEALAPAAAPFVQAMSELMAVGTQLLPKFSGYLVDVVKKFAEWVDANSKNGNMLKWIEQGIGLMGKFIDLGAAFTRFLLALAPAAEAVLPYIIDGFDAIAGLLERYPGLAQAALVSMLGWKVLVKPIWGLVKTFGIMAVILGDRLPWSAQKMAKGMEGSFLGLNSKGGPIWKMMLAGGSIFALIESLDLAKSGLNDIDGRKAPGNDLMGALKVITAHTVAGAALGTMGAPGPGTLIGGGMGIISGVGTALIDGRLANQDNGQTPDQPAAPAPVVDPKQIYPVLADQTPTLPPGTVPAVTPEDILAPKSMPVDPKQIYPVLADQTPALPPGTVVAVTPEDILAPKSMPDGVIPPALPPAPAAPIPVEVTQLPAPAVAPTDSNIPDPGPMPQVSGDLNSILSSLGLAPVDTSGSDWGSAPTLPVPTDTKDARGNAIPKTKDPAEMTDAEKRQAIENDPRFSIDNYLDPSTIADAINTAPGNVGQPPLNVKVTNQPPALAAEAAVPVVVAPAVGPAVAAAAPANAGQLSAAAIAGAQGIGSGLSAEQEQVAKTILATAEQQGYNQQQSLAILATAMQESTLDPKTPAGDGGKSHGIFQQDASYGPGRDDPAQNIKMFFDKLATHGGTQGDIWKNIFWTQQRPGEPTADAAVANGRPGYLEEIKARLGDATTFYQQMAMVANTAPVVSALNTAPGNIGQPAMKVEVVNWPGGYSGSGAGGAVMPGVLPAPVPFASLKPVDKEHPQVTAMLRVAQSFGIATKGVGSDFSGRASHPDDGLNHPKGWAGDFGQSGTKLPTDEKLAFANFMAANFSDLLNELIYGDPRFKGPFKYNQGLLNQHMDHVHASVSDANAPAFEARLNAILAKANGAIPTAPVLTNVPTPPTPTAPAQTPAVAPPVVAGQNGQPIAPTPTIPGTVPGQPLAANGKPSVLPTNVPQGAPVPLSYNDPVGAINSAPMLDPGTQQWGYWQTVPQDISDAAEALRQAGIDLATAVRDRDVVQEQLRQGVLKDPNALWEANNKIEQEKAALKRANDRNEEAKKGDFKDLPSGAQPGQAKTPKKVEPFDYSSLPKGNPMRIAAAALAGLGGDDEDIAMILGNPTADVNAAIQTVTPTASVPTVTPTASVLPGPALAAEVPSAPALPLPLPVVSADAPVAATGDWAAVGQSMGSTAGPVIAQAVAAAIAANPADSSPTVATPATPGAGMAAGGPVIGGIPGKDSVPAWLMQGEHVLTVADVNRMGGQRAVTAFRQMLQSGGFAPGGVVIDDEWKRKMALELAKAGYSGTFTVPAPPVMTAPSPSRVITPVDSSGAGLGYTPTPNVNASPGFKAGQNLTTVAANTQSVARGAYTAGQAAVEGTVQGFLHPIETAKAMAPLVNLGGDGAPNAREAWTNVAKATVASDQWADDPYAAAGTAAVNIASILWGARGLPGAAVSAANKAAKLPRLPELMANSGPALDLAMAAMAEGRLTQGALMAAGAVPFRGGVKEAVNAIPASKRLAEPRKTWEELDERVLWGDPVGIGWDQKKGAYDIDMYPASRSLTLERFQELYDVAYDVRNLVPGIGWKAVGAADMLAEHGKTGILADYGANGVFRVDIPAWNSREYLAKAFANSVFTGHFPAMGNNSPEQSLVAHEVIGHGAHYEIQKAFNVQQRILQRQKLGRPAEAGDISPLGDPGDLMKMLGHNHAALSAAIRNIFTAIYPRYKGVPFDSYNDVYRVWIEKNFPGYGRENHWEMVATTAQGGANSGVDASLGERIGYIWMQKKLEIAAAVLGKQSPNLPEIDLGIKDGSTGINPHLGGGSPSTRIPTTWDAEEKLIVSRDRARHDKLRAAGGKTYQWQGVLGNRAQRRHPQNFYQPNSKNGPKPMATAMDATDAEWLNGYRVKIGSRVEIADLILNMMGVTDEALKLGATHFTEPAGSRSLDDIARLYGVTGLTPAQIGHFPGARDLGIDAPGFNRMKPRNPLDSIAEFTEIGHDLWKTKPYFGAAKGPLREGMLDATLRGYNTPDAGSLREMIDLLTARTSKISRESWRRLHPYNYDYLDNPNPTPFELKPEYLTPEDLEMLRAYGREMAAEAAHSEPTSDLLFRGTTIPQEVFEEIIPGEVISMPPVSWGFAHGPADGFANPAWDTDWRKQVSDHMGVVFRLQPGAQAATPGKFNGFFGEQVSWGDFSVQDVYPDDNGDHFVVDVVQESMLPTGYDVAQRVPPAAITPKSDPVVDTVLLEKMLSAERRVYGEHGAGQYEELLRLYREALAAKYPAGGKASGGIVDDEWMRKMALAMGGGFPLADPGPGDVDHPSPGSGGNLGPPGGYPRTVPPPWGDIPMPGLAPGNDFGITGPWIDNQVLAPWWWWGDGRFAPGSPERRNRRGIKGYAGGGVATPMYGPDDDWWEFDGTMWHGATNNLPDYKTLIAAQKATGTGIFNPKMAPWLYGYAAGGMLPGYSPGVDNMLVPLSGGEGIIIPEAMRALGANWLYRLNSKFRSGISKQGYAEGGVTGDPLTNPNSYQANMVITLLSQIRNAVVANKTDGTTTAGTGTGADIASYATGLVGAQAVAAAAGPAGEVVNQAIADAASVVLPGPMGYAGTPTAPSTDLNTLVQERNPLALAQAAGLDVPDYTRQGGFDAGADNVQQGQTAPDANGRIYSDTAALIDRTFTNMNASEKARHDQVMGVLNEIKTNLGKDVIGPVVGDATAGALQGVAAQIGESLGQTAAPPIAAAVKSAIPAGTGSSGGVSTAQATGLLAGLTSLGVLGAAEGGGITGGTPGKDSVPAMLMPGEFVLTTAEVQRMGGFAGVERFRSALGRSGMRYYATGGNVGGKDANKTVGADFFGVSQVPIIGGLINLLITVLLKIIGVQIEQRDTLMQIGGEFRAFRGEFTAFDAMGRIYNDTSGLVDRSSTSEQEAADERIRILKLVIEGIVKFVIEKVIVPIAKAVANAVIQAGAQSASGALSAAPGGSFVAPFVSALINGAGQAGVEIGAEVYTVLAESIASLVIDTIGEALAGSEIGDAIFSGAGSAQVIDPIAGGLSGGIGGITAGLSSITALLATLFGAASFDSGGLATGTGFMPKATIAPERVLSPSQTASFDRLVAALEGGKTLGRSSTVIHAPFTVNGSEQGARTVHDRLLSLMS